MLHNIADYSTNSKECLLTSYIYILCNSVTANLWRVSIEAIDEISDVCRQRNVPLHHRLVNVLKLLREFFYCEGAGVSGQALDTEGYLVRHCN